MPAAGDVHEIHAGHVGQSVGPDEQANDTKLSVRISAID